MAHPLARPTLTFALLVVGLAAVAPAAAAQQGESEERWHPEWGDWSLSFHLPDGSGAGFGFWKQRSPNVALGLMLDGTVALSSRRDGFHAFSSSDIALSIGPALKRYWWRQGPVSPFLHTGLAGTYRRTEGAGSSAWRFGGGFTLGLGADWFPAEGISIGGHTGVSASYLWTTDDDEVPAIENLLVTDLFTSTLSFHLYF